MPSNTTTTTVTNGTVPANASASNSSCSVTFAANQRSLSSTPPLTLSSLVIGSTKIVSSVLSSNPFPAGYHPMGYSLTKRGKTFLEFGGSKDSEIGLFLLTLKGGRRSTKSLKQQWTTIVRISKGGGHMSILRKLPEIIEFCLAAGLID